jgi:hypothetical protein
MGIGGLKILTGPTAGGPWTEIPYTAIKRVEAFELYNGRSVTSVTGTATSNQITIRPANTADTTKVASWPSVVDIVFESNLTAAFIMVYINDSYGQPCAALCEVELYRREDVTGSVKSFELAHQMDVKLSSITARTGTLEMKNQNLTFTKADFTKPSTGQLSFDVTPEIMVWLGINGELVKQGWFAVDQADFDPITRNMSITLRSRTEKSMFEKNVTTYRREIGISDAIELSSNLANINSGLVATGKNMATIPVFSPDDKARSVIDGLMVANGERGTYVDNDGLIRSTERANQFYPVRKANIPNVDLRAYRANRASEVGGTMLSTTPVIPPIQFSMFFDVVATRKLWFPDVNFIQYKPGTTSIFRMGTDNLSVWDVKTPFSSRVGVHYIGHSDNETLAAKNSIIQLPGTHGQPPGYIQYDPYDNECFLYNVNAKRPSGYRVFFAGGCWPNLHMREADTAPGWPWTSTNTITNSPLALARSWQFLNGNAYEEYIPNGNWPVAGGFELNPPGTFCVAECAVLASNYIYVWYKPLTRNTRPSAKITHYLWRFSLARMFALPEYIGSEDAYNIRDMVVVPGPTRATIWYARDHELIRWYEGFEAFTARVSMGAVFPTVNSQNPVITRIVFDDTTANYVLWITGAATSYSGYQAWDYPMAWERTLCRWDTSSTWASKTFPAAGYKTYSAGAAAVAQGRLYFINAGQGPATDPPTLESWNGVNNATPVSLGYAGGLGGQELLGAAGNGGVFPNHYSGMAISALFTEGRYIAAWCGGTRIMSVWKLNPAVGGGSAQPSATLRANVISEMRESVSYELGGGPTAIGAVEVPINDATESAQDVYSITARNISTVQHFIKLSSPVDPLTIASAGSYSGIVRRHALKPVIYSYYPGGTIKATTAAFSSSPWMFGVDVTQDPERKTILPIQSAYIFDTGTAGNIAALVLSENRTALTWTTIELPIMPHVELGDAVNVLFIQRTGPKAVTVNQNYVVVAVNHRVSIGDDSGEARTVLELVART